MWALRYFGRAELLADSGPKRHRLQTVPEINLPPAQPRADRAHAIPGLAAALVFAGRFAMQCGARSLPSRLANWAATVDPASLAANLLAARTARQVGDLSAEFALSRAAAENDDNRKRGHWEVAKLLLRVERQNLLAPSDASGSRLISALEAASASTDPSIRAAAGVAFSDALREAGAYSESVSPAQSALAVQPSHLAAARALADSLIATKRFEEAKTFCASYLRQPDEAGLGRRGRLAGLLVECAGLTVESGAHIGREDPKILVAVGGGIGDILHATPTIQNIAQRTGNRVDVLVAADSPGAEFLVRNPNCVRAVWPDEADVFAHRYEIAFFTHSMGSARFAVNAERVVAAHEWRRFRPGQLNETAFNLEAARHLLDISYETGDEERYFVGDLAYVPLRNPRVGLQAGSKAGRWLSKRWPFFPELATRLKARGIRVASFGAPDEYVEGTEDCTGGTIEQMSRAMLACTHFVCNDSGPMHIASALGIPVLALFAPTDPLTHLPMGETTVALALEKACAPCEVRDHAFFASGGCRCIAEIPASAVEEKVLEMMVSPNGTSVDRNRPSIGPRQPAYGSAR